MVRMMTASRGDSSSDGTHYDDYSEHHTDSVRYRRKCVSSLEPVLAYSKSLPKTDTKPKKSLIAVAVLVSHHANASAAFVLCAASTVIFGGGYRTSSICPVAHALREALNLFSPVLFASYKTAMSSYCDDEDSLWRFFYDTWPKSLITNTDSWPQLFVSVFQFFSLKATAVFVMLLLVALAGAVVWQITSLLEEIAIKMICCVGSNDNGVTNFLQRVLIGTLHLPLFLLGFLHRYVMHPIGWTLCVIPSRIWRLVPGLSAYPFPLAIFTEWAFDDHKVLMRLTYWSLVFRFRFLFACIIQWFIALFALNAALRSLCIWTQQGHWIVRAFGWAWNFGDANGYFDKQFSRYKLLTYSGLADDAMFPVVEELYLRITSVRAMTTHTWLALASFVALTAVLHWICHVRPDKEPVSHRLKGDKEIKREN